jgi:hypothetical protein
MMIQNQILQAFASAPVQAAAVQRAAGRSACASCGRIGCNCTAAADAARQATDVQPVDELELSEEAQAFAEQQSVDSPRETEASPETEKATDAQGRQAHDEKPTEGEEESRSEAGSDLSEEQQQQVAELKNRDREVRAHEQAHMAVAGPYARGGPTFSYQEGPDGKQYAVGGEVSIDTSPVSGDPEATIQKAQQIRAAALAPARPSGQDQRVAAAATQMEAQARAELAKQNRPGTSYGSSEDEEPTGTLLDLVA